MGGKALAEIRYSGTLLSRSIPGPSGTFTTRVTQSFDPETLSHFPANERKAAEKASIEIEMEWSRDGNLTALRAPKASSAAEEENLRVLLDLAAPLAFSRFEDSLGAYDAVLEQEPNRVLKIKTGYLEARNAAEILDSRHALSLNGSGIEGLDSLRIGKGAFAVTQDSQYRLEKISALEVPASFPASASATRNFLPTSLTLAPSPGARSPASFGASSRKRADWSMLSEALSNLSTLDSHARLSLFHELVLSLEKTPSLIANVRLKITESLGDASLFRLGIGALASLATEDAQAALLEIYREESLNLTQKQMILASLTTADGALSGDTQAFLKGIALDPNAPAGTAESAAFAIGSSLQKETNPVLRADLERTLVSLLSDAKTPGDQAQVLDAIGNSGDLALLPAIRDFLGSVDVTLQSKAVFALRWMPAGEVAPLLVPALSDAKAPVRVSAIQAISHLKERGVDLDLYANAIEACSNQDPDENLRTRCKALLAP